MRSGFAAGDGGFLDALAEIRNLTAPQMPGPEIGLIRTRSAFSLTAPDLRQAISASVRHGSRSAD